MLENKKDDIIMKLTVTKTVSNKEVITNFVGNMLTRAGGDIANIVHLILTRDNLYLEYMGHCAIGYAEEVRKVEKIELRKLDIFKVDKLSEIEQIRIETDGEEYLFERKNLNNDDLSLAMEKVINDLKI